MANRSRFFLVATIMLSAFLLEITSWAPREIAESAEVTSGELERGLGL